MPTFAHSPLLWGLLLVGVPVLIHLINMLRHRRVPWAAMEFLLQSQKKNRTWIVLKQLLLLLLRMLAVALVVLAVAQPLLRNELGNLLGSTQTHHIVLLDDSYSMSDRWADTSAFAEAKAVVERIGTEAARLNQPQSFTLLRFSHAGRTGRGTHPDLLKETVTTEFGKRITETLRPIEVSQTAAGPTAALEAIDQLLGGAESERRIVYLVSDFRARQWDDATELRQRLQRLNQAGAELHLVNCIEREQANLAITALTPGEGTRAAGVPWFMEVTVENFGPATAKDVPVLLEEDGHGRAGLTIAQVPPRKAVKERFQVQFPTAGTHRLVARLEPDAVATDNFRYALIDLPAEVPVLMIDGDSEALDARFVSAALAPGGPVRTGINPRTESPRFLDQAATAAARANQLDKFHTIYLLNVDRLDPAAITALENYVREGGNVACFVGPRSQTKTITDQWYRDGEGFFPLPLAAPAELLVDRLQKAPDVEVTDHPMFRILSGKQNSFIATVLVQHYLAAPEAWRPPTDSTTRVIARLRNGAPLAVERTLGRGRVVAFTTTATPTWNNWARNPSFVIALQDLQAYLSRQPADAARQVGSPLQLTLDAARYQKHVRFVTPNEGTRPTATIDAAPARDGTLAASLAETDTAGFYQARLTRTDGTTEVRQWAVNLDPREGDLKSLAGPQLAARLENVKYQYDLAAAFHYAGGETAGYNLSEFLLYLLIVLLLAEQVLAWSASYHPPMRRPAAAAGGAR